MSHDNQMNFAGTYSNIYNHPATIEVPKKQKPIKLAKVGGCEIPAESIAQRGLTKKQLQQLDQVNYYQSKTILPPTKAIQVMNQLCLCISNLFDVVFEPSH